VLPEPLTVATPDLPVIRFEYRADLARRL